MNLERDYELALIELERAAYALALHLGRRAADVDPEGDATPDELDKELADADPDRAEHIARLVHFLREEQVHLPRSYFGKARASRHAEMKWQIAKVDKP